MVQLLWIGLGSAAGGCARYLVSIGMARALGSAFPYGTLTVNVVGGFLIAVVMHAGLEAAVLSATARLALTTGVLGGLTTFSTFSYETVQLLRAGETLAAAGNAAANLVGAILACLAGGVFARWILPT